MVPMQSNFFNKRKCEHWMEQWFIAKQQNNTIIKIEDKELKRELFDELERKKNLLIVY